VSLTTVLRISSILGSDPEPTEFPGGFGWRASGALCFSAIGARGRADGLAAARSVTLRERAGIVAGAPRTVGWSGDCPTGDRLEQRSPSKRRSAAMMFAFVIALVGIAVLGAMDLAASHG
jgi:hypothetical protein